MQHEDVREPFRIHQNNTGRRGKLFARIALLLALALLLGTPARSQDCGGGVPPDGMPGGNPGGPALLEDQADDQPAGPPDRNSIERGSFTEAPVTKIRTDQLTPEEVTALFAELRAWLEGKKLPSKWLDDLETADDIELKFELEKSDDVFARYHPGYNDVQMQKTMDLDNLSEEDKKTLVHELFHAWYDQIADIDELWLSDAAEEGVAHALEDLMRNGSISTTASTAGGTALSKGGTQAEGLKALIEVDKIFIEKGYGSWFQNGFQGAPDTSKYAIVERVNPDMSGELTQLWDHVETVTGVDFGPVAAPGQ